MKPSIRAILPSLFGAILLAGCGGGGKDGKPAPESDPAVTGALGDEIMVDPELAGQQGSAGTSSIELPPEQRTPEAIAAAKAEALRLAGGAITSAPAPSGDGNAAELFERAATAAQVAAATKAGKVDCAGKVDYSARWANALPAALAVYPRGAVQEAAGTDSDGCRLRVVSFVTPVAASEIIDFYFTRLRSDGYDARHQKDGEGHVLGGGKGAAAYVVHARRLDNGLTEVDLVSGGA